MNKPILRAISLLLVGCLLANPVAASAFVPSLIQPDVIEQQPLFQQEALVQRALFDLHDFAPVIRKAVSELYRVAFPPKKQEIFYTLTGGLFSTLTYFSRPTFDALQPERELEMRRLESRILQYIELRENAKWGFTPTILTELLGLPATDSERVRQALDNLVDQHVVFHDPAPKQTEQLYSWTDDPVNRQAFEYSDRRLFWNKQQLKEKIVAQLLEWNAPISITLLAFRLHFWGPPGEMAIAVNELQTEGKVVQRADQKWVHASWVDKPEPRSANFANLGQLIEKGSHVVYERVSHTRKPRVQKPPVFMDILAYKGIPVPVVEKSLGQTLALFLREPDSELSIGTTRRALGSRPYQVIRDQLRSLREYGMLRAQSRPWKLYYRLNPELRKILDSDPAALQRLFQAAPLIARDPSSSGKEIDVLAAALGVTRDALNDNSADEPTDRGRRDISRLGTAALAYLLIPKRVHALLSSLSQASETGPQNFLNNLAAHVHRQPGGLAAFIATHPELQRSIANRSKSSQETEILLHAYLLFLFFRQGGISGSEVSNQGHILEDYIRTVIENTGRLVGISSEFSFLIHNPPAEAERIVPLLPAQFHPDEKEKNSLLGLFHPGTSDARITPFGSYVFLGAYLRYFGLSDGVRIVMGEDNTLLLRVNLESPTPLYIRIDPATSLFDVADGKVEEAPRPTLDAVKAYDVIQASDHKYLKRIFSGKAHEVAQAMETITASLYDLKFFAPVAEALAPTLFTAQAEDRYKNSENRLVKTERQLFGDPELEYGNPGAAIAMPDPIALEETAVIERTLKNLSEGRLYFKVNLTHYELLRAYAREHQLPLNFDSEVVSRATSGFVLGRISRKGPIVLQENALIRISNMPKRSTTTEGSIYISAGRQDRGLKLSGGIFLAPFLPIMKQVQQALGMDWQLIEFAIELRKRHDFKGETDYDARTVILVYGLILEDTRLAVGILIDEFRHLLTGDADDINTPESLKIWMRYAGIGSVLETLEKRLNLWLEVANQTMEEGPLKGYSLVDLLEGSFLMNHLGPEEMNLLINEVARLVAKAFAAHKETLPAAALRYPGSEEQRRLYGDLQRVRSAA